MPHRLLAALAALCLATAAVAGPFAPGDADDLDDDAGASAPVTLPPGVHRVSDQPYGTDPRQRYDAYVPAAAASAPGGAPILFMVHGGGWRLGTRTMSRTVAHKMAHWTARGWVVVSIDYRLLPDTPVTGQLEDVARALAQVQRDAPRWGGDPKRIVIAGHSAGAHLVAWLAAGGPAPAGVTLLPWKGAVLLDSAVYDVSVLMRYRHFKLYDEAMGRDAAAWPALSPQAQLRAGRTMPPMLAVCSTKRRLSCPMADAFAAQARATGTRAEVLRQDRSHGQINDDLGLDGDYTEAVDRFIASLG